MNLKKVSKQEAWLIGGIVAIIVAWVAAMIVRNQREKLVADIRAAIRAGVGDSGISGTIGSNPVTFENVNNAERDKYAAKAAADALALWMCDGDNRPPASPFPLGGLLPNLDDDARAFEILSRQTKTSLRWLDFAFNNLYKMSIDTFLRTRLFNDFGDSSKLQRAYEIVRNLPD
ncbi:hypothetical protein [Rhodoflexus caldus]|uniref:hypothetical protein n=1 Tax=Rhodoflexus caldus TaxID=2891236 RepID=UPI00202A31A4|nr:hypothetical protein [Rhodoflexus caldus]